MAKVDLYDKMSKVPSTIAIYGAPNSTPSSDKPKLDEIDANTHETFTLEELGTLIAAYRKKNKDFILARVTTPDPENNSVFYNFYYAAAEINRILFRYEPSRRLLHRMKVKNPLNNMYIIGQVYYYKITPHDVDKSIITYLFKDTKEKENPKKAFSAVFRKKTDFANHQRKSNSKDCLDIRENCKFAEEIEGKSTKEIIEKLNKGQLQIAEIKDKKKKLRYKANYFASDDDFLTNQDVRDYFKRNALEPEDDFLYDLDRTQNDFMALLDNDSQEEEEELSDWRRVLSAHISLAVSMLFVCLVMGGGPGVALVFLPLALIIFLSFIGSLCYVLCCRRGSFDTLAVNSVEENEGL